MGKRSVLLVAMLVALTTAAPQALAQIVPEQCPPVGLVAIVDPDTGELVGCTDPADPCPPGTEPVFISSFELFCSPTDGGAPVELSQEIGQESESGEVDLSFEVSSTGDYARQCVAPVQIGNTGNLQNGQGFTQFGSTSDDLEAEGSSFGFEPSVETACDQAVQQSAAASS